MSHNHQVCTRPRIWVFDDVIPNDLLDKVLLWSELTTYRPCQTLKYISASMHYYMYGKMRCARQRPSDLHVTHIYIYIYIYTIIPIEYVVESTSIKPYILARLTRASSTAMHRNGSTNTTAKTKNAHAFGTTSMWSSPGCSEKSAVPT